MLLNRKTGLISPAKCVMSPNQDLRPDDTVIDAIVIHAISLPPGNYHGMFIDDLFCNRLAPQADPYFAEICGLKVSAHFLVRRDGELVQFVPAEMRAWHAGQSELFGQSCVNDFSIGIELEGSEDDTFMDVQYDILTRLTQTLMDSYRAISLERIVGHSDVSPGRKTDPGPYFDWYRYKSMIQR